MWGIWSVLTAELQEGHSLGSSLPHTAHLHTFSLENQQQTCPSFPSTARQDRLTFSFQILFTTKVTQEAEFGRFRGGGGNDPSLAISVPSTTVGALAAFLH